MPEKSATEIRLANDAIMAAATIVVGIALTLLIMHDYTPKKENIVICSNSITGDFYQFNAIKLEKVVNKVRMNLKQKGKVYDFTSKQKITLNYTMLASIYCYNKDGNTTDGYTPRLTTWRRSKND